MPHGVDHLPRAGDEVSLLVFKPGVTPNSRNALEERTVAQFGYGSRLPVLRRDEVAHASDGAAKNSK